MKKSLIAFALVAGLGYAGYHGYQIYISPAETTQAQKQPQVVDVISVQTENIEPEVSFVAKITSPDRVGLRARVSGFLQEKLFNEGEIVQKGQPLFIIEKVNFEARVRQAEANLAQAEANAINAKAQFERTKILYETKDVSTAKLDEAQAARDSAIAAVSQMRAQLDLAKKDLEYTTIVSPIDGKIGEKTFSVGELIGPESGVLAEIVSVNPMNAVFSVSENQLLTLQEQFGKKEDTTVQFIMANNKVYPLEGILKFIDVSLNESMNTLKMKASFPNPEQLLIPGQYGRVLLKGKHPINRIVIPMKAVQRDLKGAYVYLVDNENKVIKQNIKTGLELPDFKVIIEDGLTSGEKIIIAGFQKIAPNMTVTPQPVE